MATRFKPQSRREAPLPAGSPPLRSLRKWRSVLKRPATRYGQDDDVIPRAADRRIRAGIAAGRVPDITAVSGSVPPVAAPTPAATAAPLSAQRGRPMIVRIGKRLRGLFDRLIASSSLVSNAPVLDVRDFAWTAALRDNWQAIRDEATAVALAQGAAPSLAAISPDHRSIARMDMWRSFFLWGYGYPIADNLDRCPRTRAVVAAIPGLNSAFFSILAPGTHIPAHRGVTKGLLTCHLGLVVPRNGDVRMRVDDRIVRWAEGETLMFDDTCDHEVWNDTDGTRVVLLIQVERPLRNPGRWIARRFLSAVRRSAFVQEARDNIRSWNAAAAAMDM